MRYVVCGIGRVEAGRATKKGGLARVWKDQEGCLAWILHVETMRAGKDGEGEERRQ